jgi:hypothetical protein
VRAYQIENKRIVCRADSLLARALKRIPHKVFPSLVMEAARVGFDTTTYVQIFLRGNQNVQ